MNRQGLPANATFHNDASFLSSSKDIHPVYLSHYYLIYIDAGSLFRFCSYRGAGVGSAEIIGPASELNQ